MRNLFVRALPWISYPSASLLLLIFSVLDGAVRFSIVDAFVLLFLPLSPLMLLDVGKHDLNLFNLMGRNAWIFVLSIHASLCFLTLGAISICFGFLTSVLGVVPGKMQMSEAVSILCVVALSPFVIHMGYHSTLKLLHRVQKRTEKLKRQEDDPWIFQEMEVVVEEPSFLAEVHFPSEKIR